MVIRKIDERDIAALSILSKENLSEGFRERDFFETLKNQNAIMLLAENKDIPLGFAVGIFAADEGELIQIAVDEVHRKNGIGKQIINTLIEEFKNKGVKNIFLEVRETNDSAKSFYDNLGFEQIGRRKGFYDSPKEDALVLRLDIGNA